MSALSLDDDLVLDYLAESSDHLATIETDLLAMEQAGAARDEQLVNRVFRAAHSIKGGAGFFDLLVIQELAHHTESVLDLMRSSEMAPNSGNVGVLLLAFDQLRSLISDYANSNRVDISELTARLRRVEEEHWGSSIPRAVPHPTPFDTTGPSRNAASQTTRVETTVRVNVALLDSLTALTGELVVIKNRLNEAVRNDDEQGIRAGCHRVSLVTTELQAAVSLTRRQPASSLFAKFPRMVRDLANELGKEVQIELEGGDLELDKTLLEGLSDPLTHMIRNSIDHGIETPTERRAAGKAPVGTIVLRAKHQAGKVVIELSDDGKGLAGEKIGASAVAKGMITAGQLRTMNEYDKMALIFMPGVSTAEKLSNVSGRGVGMDVVKTNLDKLGGTVKIESVPGQGAAFRIELPLTLAIIPSLLVSDSGERFAIPPSQRH